MEAMSLSRVPCIERRASVKGTGAITHFTHRILLCGDMYVQCAYELILYSCSAVPSTRCPLCEISGCYSFYFL